MICLEQQDKRLCVISYCTATSFFGLSLARKQKATEHPSSKLKEITSKIKIERLTRRAALALRGLLRVFGRFAKPQPAPELHS
jgi:hypothetical protein